MRSRPIYIGIFLLSLSLLLYELTLIRVYSTILFYHYAFMAISVAMLGLAASGLTVHFAPRRFSKDRLAFWASRWTIVYAIALPLVFWTVFRIPTNAYLPPDQIAGKLTLIYLLSAVPFYFAGLAISGTFAALPEFIGGLYGWDLAGAGLGALAMIPLINLAGGESIVFFIVAVALLAGFSFAVGSLRTVLLISVFLAIGLGLVNHSLGLVKIKFSKGSTLEGLDVRFNKWNSFSRIMAIPFRPGSGEVYTWCPSPLFPLPTREHMSIMIDDGAATPVVPFNDRDLDSVAYLKYDLTSFGHRMRGDGKTLIIGSGGGRDVLTGLLFGAQQIDAVDINPLMFEAMNGPLAKFDGDLYHHPKVNGIVSEGRAFARRHPDSYDLVQVAMIDTWAATTAGAYSLSENTLYTVEAFEDYLRALKPDGIVAFTRFYFQPPQQALRLASLYLEAAKRIGIAAPERCMLIGQYESLATLLFSKRPFTVSETHQFKSEISQLGFNLIYAPDGRPDPYFRALVDAPDREAFYAAYPFDVSPPDDNRPFFFNMLKMRDFLRVFELNEGQKFNFYATYTLLVVLLLSVVMTAVVLIAPALLHSGGPQPPGGWQLPLYFVAIGLSYIVVETVLLQRFVLLLEHPAYAASGVVAGMLISSGVGSYLWGRASPNLKPRLLRMAFWVIGLGLLIHILIGSWVIHSVIGLPISLKVVVALILIVPLGVAMGVPLPAGIAKAAGGGASTIGWCWALNGAASVVASSLAVALAMAYGFTVALTAGLVTYFTAYFLLPKIR